MLFSPCSIRSYLFEKRTLLYASSDPSCKGLGHWRSSVRKARWWAGSVLGSGSYLAGNILILSVLCFALLLLLFSFFFIFFCILLSGSFRKMLSKSPTRCWMGYSTEPLSSHLSPRWRVQQRQRWRLLILRSLSLYIYICIFRVDRTIAGPMKSRGKKEEKPSRRSSRLPLNWLPSDHNWGRRAPERGTIWRSTSVAHNNEDGKIVGANRREKKKKDREGL